MTPEPRLFFIGVFPPPVTGQALVSEMLADRLAASLQVCRLDQSSGRLQRNAGYHFTRLRRCLAGTATLLAQIRAGDAVLISLDSGYGLVYQLLLMLAARARGARFIFSHHSFSYLLAPSRLIRFVVALSRNRNLHLFLCRRMRDAFQARYGRVGDALILSNIAFFDRVGCPERSQGVGRCLKVGLISNLCADKGLDTFLDLLLRAGEQGLPLEGRLAGPFQSDADRRLYEAAAGRLGGHLRYLGKVLGHEKEAFFADIDVLLFPSRYPLEAQPLVLFEAAARGIPAIATDRGCVAEDVDRAVTVVPPTADFATFALAQLEKWSNNPADLRQAGMCMTRRFDRLRAEANGQLDELVTRIRHGRRQEARRRQHATAP